MFNLFLFLMCVSLTLARIDYPGAGGVHIFSELDGLRVVSDTSHEFLQRVPCEQIGYSLCTLLYTVYSTLAQYCK